MRPLADPARTNTDAITASNRGAIARISSSSPGVVRSDTSIPVTPGHRRRSSGRKVRLGAAMRHPVGKSSMDR
jgi:hypothetical protein